MCVGGAVQVKIKDAARWEQYVEKNPLPDGWTKDPSTWSEGSPEAMDKGYGAVVIVFAEKLADLAEKFLDAGIEMKDIIAQCVKAVDHEFGNWGLTGFQYGAVVTTLAQTWEHGEELRRWHNLSTQIRDEGERANEDGGVLNPALLNISLPGEVDHG